MSSLEPRPGHVVALAELPWCDVCQDAHAAFDCVTLNGHTWANLCELCARTHALRYGVTGVGIGQRLVLREVGA